MLRLALDDIRPPIWRRVAVPGNITLDLLHDVLQVAMGWEDYHLHEFTINGLRYTEDPEEPEQGLEETGIALMSLLAPATEKKIAFGYLYDFGDGWRHTVKVEKVAPVPAGHDIRITCLGGKRRCPPEDVGGPWGYADYLNAIADLDHEEHQDMLA
ncbi:MAG TPA: plasmid pRiA4b ORF-3 family protein [Phycisphaerae bacterium]|nr:plasmid pRiA4b ORF-3 family protein [Phycisphaerae bacterium]